MSGFLKEKGDWTCYRKLPNVLEVDFHWQTNGPRKTDYWDCMAEVYTVAFDALKKAQAEGNQFVLFTHGASTSRTGQTTARSMVRGLMRSKESTPYIMKSKSIQHNTVFVAAIRPKAG